MAPGTDFGTRLRQARERKGVSLREIARKTKISVGVLESLERNDISRLPGGLFSRAFVRSYALEVGLDPERTVEEFITTFAQDSVGAGTSPSGQPDDSQSIESDRRTAQTALKLLLVSVPIGGALIYLSLPGRRDTVVSRQSSDAVVSDAPTPAAATQSADPTASAPSTALIVSIRPLAKCWISLIVDGERRAGRTIQPGDDVRVSAASEIVLTAADASALQLTINGSPARALGRSGEVVTKRITLQNYRSLIQ